MEKKKILYNIKQIKIQIRMLKDVRHHYLMHCNLGIRKTSKQWRRLNQLKKDRQALQLRLEELYKEYYGEEEYAKRGIQHRSTL